MISTSGHRPLICPTILSSSSSDPLAASMFDGLKPSAQQVLVTENVQRQVAVTAVVPAEEAALLLTVERIVCRVEVQDDCLPWLWECIQEGVDEEPIYRLRPTRDLVVSVGRCRVGGCKLKPIERALPRKGETPIPLTHSVFSSRIGLANQCRQQCVATKHVVVVDVLIAKRYRIHPLGNQLGNAVLDQLCDPIIDKALRKTPEDPRALLDLSKQQAPSVGRDPASAEIRHHLARAKALKLELLGITLCMQNLGSFLRCNCLRQQYFTPRLEPFFNLLVRYAG